MTILSSIIITLALALIAIAFYTLIERKFLGYFQTRKGPNKPNIIGLPQPFADAIKLFIKEYTCPTIANNILFILAPLLSLLLGILIWPLYPHNRSSFYWNLGILYFLCVSRIRVYALFIAGWSSNSKYALLGALRGVAQTISYEVRIALILITILIGLISINLTFIFLNQFSLILLIIFPISIIWLITIIAETNRAPLDFAEGESELVSGFNVEYGGRSFALIFIAEYLNILFIRLIISVLLTNNILNIVLIIKTTILAIVFVWIRASFPRIRYDHLIILTWKCLLPLTLIILIIIAPITFII